MKKPLCLALSVLLAPQACLLPAFAEPASPSIWQKLAGASTPAPMPRSVQGSKAKPYTSPPHRALSASSAGAASATAGHAMLFLKQKDSGSGSSSGAPAAALTIHPSLDIAADQSVPATSTAAEKPTLLALNQGGSPAVADKQLLAQLTPDHIVAQGEAPSPAATPIPPVVTGAVELEEFKPSNVIDLKVSQSRTFKLRNKIVRTSISDPSIAEPVVVAENQIVLLGKSPGGATLVIWDDAGNSMAVDLKVSRDYAQLQAMLREIDPRIIAKPFSVGGGDRVVLMGDVDHSESVIRAMGAANAFMDDRGMKIVAANGRIVDVRIGEQGTGAGGAAGGQTGALAQLSQVDKYLYFSNANNNVAKAHALVSEGGRVTSIVKVRKTPLIVLHVTFMEMNTASVRELGVQLGMNFTSQSFGFAMGGQSLSGTNANGGVPFYLTSLPGTNGTQGTQIPVAGGLPNGLGLGLVTIPGITLPSPPFAPGTPVTFFNPPFPGPQFGATTAPVSFNAANVVQSVIPGTQQIQTTNISALGQGVLNTPASALLNGQVLFGQPGGATFSPVNLANLFTAISNFASGHASRWALNPTVNGIISHSRARVLAEPTLVTVSGERASFLAGAEIPLPQSGASAGQTQLQIVFEPFGLRLNMIPVLLENGNINLQVSPEERTLGSFFNLGFGIGQVPSFTTRKTQTIVEMKPGQELFISGLVSANSGRELTKTPLLGEVPVLGALYRSKAFAKNESELVVAVRPEVILPGNPGQLKLPEEISRVEGPRDTNLLQVEPTIVDERYMSTGRADRSQKIPGILPPGSPIPDNQ